MTNKNIEYISEKQVSLFNDIYHNDCIQINSKEMKNENRYNYKFSNDDHTIELNNTNVIEKIYLPDITHNMFITFSDRGRFGNYIYGAIFATMSLLELEHKFTNKPYTEIVDNLKNNKLSSKLYSRFNCMYVNDEYSKIFDKYYFKSHGIDSFKYFNCHHFVDATFDNLICEKNVDIIISNSYNNDKIYVINNKLYFYIEFLGNINTSNNSNQNQNDFTYGELVELDIISDFLEYKKFNITYINDKRSTNKLVNMLTNLDKYEHNLIIEELNNELKKCFIENNKIILYVASSGTIYKNFVEHYYFPNYGNKDLIKSIKNIIFEDDNNEIKNIYESYLNIFSDKLNEKVFIVAHFRGGDYESDTDYNFLVLHPIYYINALDKIMKQLKKEENDIILLCCFHPNDIIFNAYIGSIKYKYPKITINTEETVTNNFPKSKSIFKSESKHILFMSMFKYIIASNSSYSLIACKFNLNENKIIIGDLNCYGISRETLNDFIDYKIINNCGMNNKQTRLNFAVCYILYYYIYENNKTNIKINENIKLTEDIVTKTNVLCYNIGNCNKYNINNNIKNEVLLYLEKYSNYDIVLELKKINKFAEIVTYIDNTHIAFQLNNEIFKIEILFDKQYYYKFTKTPQIIQNAGYKYNKYITKIKNLTNYT